MAKKQNNTEAASPEATENQFPADIGIATEAELQGLKEYNPFAAIPCFVPGKNLEEGMTLTGRVKLTKRVYSDRKSVV